MQRNLNFQFCSFAKLGFSLPSSRPGEFEPAALMAIELRCLKHIVETGPNNQWGIHTYAKYAHYANALEQLETMDAPVIRLNGTETSLLIEDGRHRLQALEYGGISEVQIAVPRCQVEKIQLLLDAAKGSLNCSGA